MKYASVYGSPGTRVRFLGFAATYCPFLILPFALGWFMHALFPLPIPQWTAALAFIAVLFLAWAAIDKTERRFKNYLKGAHGEEIVARELAFLPDGWSVFHGVPRSVATPGGSDFDHIAIGTTGIFVIETKNWNGPVNANGINVTTGAYTAARSPVAQARREALELRKLLGDALPAGAPILGVVCFASNGLVSDCIKIDFTPLVNVRALRRLLESSEPAGLDPAVIAALTERLRGLLEYSPEK